METTLPTIFTCCFYQFSVYHSLSPYLPNSSSGIKFTLCFFSTSSFCSILYKIALLGWFSLLYISFPYKLAVCYSPTPAVFHICLLDSTFSTMHESVCRTRKITNLFSDCSGAQTAVGCLGFVFFLFPLFVHRISVLCCREHNNCGVTACSLRKWLFEKLFPKFVSWTAPSTLPIMETSTLSPFLSRCDSEGVTCLMTSRILGAPPIQSSLLKLGSA